ncbi:MAG: glutamate-5-semialdehyde dehydrogenase [Alphaproteobacteria bacterium]|jgi:glutamate-5-semialdehyde dehydrogenase|nr:glutamate-5-semialdehyde dehydrogenase [Alphaproteobacteria bacterium]MBT4709942.1 glutamate-5-semialdehyde dehydrogenase [Alphaproteobacteria bacterium]
MTAAAAKTDDVGVIMAGIGAAARDAAAPMAQASTAAKNKALTVAAETVVASTEQILAANALDLEAAKTKGLSAAMTDRLVLTVDRIAAMANGLVEIAALDDPVGAVIAEWDRPNGLHISRVRVPLGVIGVIYESRPNVTADAGALCLKSGNPAILRGGSESFHSSRAIFQALQAGVAAAGLPAGALQLIPTRDRDAVGAMLAMSEVIDVIIPRGGRSLIERVQKDSRVPVFAHLEGVCHVYVHEDADKDMARDIVVNAKMRRTGVCGAAETLLVDRSVRDSHLPMILDALADAGCAVRGDAETMAIDSRATQAGEDDWRAEYLDAVMAVRVVDGLDQAIDHVNTFGSHHTDAIVTADSAAAETFLAKVDSAIVLHNASTQYADGGEFGMGAEIGISTGRLHARGPVGVEQLTTFKYVIHGTGQTRP